MKSLLLLIMVALSLSVMGQSRDTLERRMHLPNGITHHTIKENKISLMHHANYCKEKIKEYKRKRNFGFGVALVGGGILYYACDHMKVPVDFSNRALRSQYNDRRRDRRIVGAIGAAIIGTGIYISLKNVKLLKQAELHLEPTTGGVRFYF